MCTVVVSIVPDAAVPVVLAGVRDEFLDRPWQAPAQHWPEYAGIWGGLDIAGGTWLAVDPAANRIAALVNGDEVPARDPRRRSRGELPLQTVVKGDLPDLELNRYPPFYLILASVEGVRLWDWDGERLVEGPLPQGTHFIVNNGWERNDDDPRVTHFRPRFDAAARPDRIDSRPPQEYWGEWLNLATGDQIPYTDPRTLIVRERGSSTGRMWGSLSTSLFALTHHGIRYDFAPDPRDPATFHHIAM